MGPRGEDALLVGIDGEVADVEDAGEGLLADIVLRAQGHELDEYDEYLSALPAAARQGIEGIERALTQMLSDLGLPDGSGHDLMRTLRERHGLRGIALSGYGMEEDLRRSKEAGFLEHLTKPVDLPTLEAALQRAAPTRSTGPRVRAL